MPCSDHKLIVAKIVHFILFLLLLPLHDINAWSVALRWIRRKKYPDLYTASHTKCLASFIPRPLPDFILQLWRKLRVFLSCETKSGSGLGTRLSLSYCFSMGFIRMFFIWVVGIRWFEERRTLEEVNVRWSMLFLVHNGWSMNGFQCKAQACF